MKKYLNLRVSALALGLSGMFIANPSLANGNNISHDDGISASVSASTLPDGIRLVETNEVEPGKIGIAYEKYELENGLTVILHKDNSDPLVQVQVTYHVGSAREEVGRSGFAHFFEHMMFQGSENAPNGLHQDLINGAGGRQNGSTSNDLTNYFQTVPSNYLEQVLWLEADRMGFLLPAVTQEKFDIQRATVKNERGQRVDNRPYGRLAEQIGEALYPAGHPYSWSTIGYLEDLDRASLDDLKRFFNRWYGPNNAVIAIAGDIDTSETLRWIKKYYGSIPRGPEVRAAKPQPSKLSNNRFVTMEDKVPAPLLSISFPTVYAGHDDEAALDVLQTILGGGNNSLLYQNLQKKGLTSQTSASHRCSELACIFAIVAVQIPKDDVSLRNINKIVKKTFEDFEKRGVKQKDIDLLVSRRITGYSLSLDGVGSKARILASNEVFGGDPDQIQDIIDRYKSVTIEDVNRVYRKYIKNKPSLTISVVPEGRTDLAAAENNWTMEPRAIPDFSETANLDADKLAESFDRSVIPSPSDKDIAVKAPNVWKDSLVNGIKLVGNSDNESPITTVMLRIGAGQQNQDIDKLGVSSFVLEMLGDDTTKNTTEELDEKMTKIGASLSITAGNTDTTFRLTSRSENLQQSLEILKERLLSPKFDPENFERIKRVRLQNLKVNEGIATRQSQRVFQEKLYGAENPIAYSSLGVIETVEDITLEDVIAFYKKHYVPQVSSITVVSDLSEETLKDNFKVLESWSGPDFEVASLNKLPALEAGTIYLIDIPGAAQSSIKIGSRALPEDVSGDFYRLNFINTPLGGNFGSRINLNLREEKGYTYGARTSFTGSKLAGHFVASSEVRTNATGPAISEFLKELDKFHNEGPTQDELNEAANSARKGEALAYEVSFGKLTYLSKIDQFDADLDYASKRIEMLGQLTKAEADKLAYKYFDPENMIIVVAGDKKEIINDLKTLGKKIVDIKAK